MLNDSLEKTIKIPVRISNGKVRYFYGGELPDIENGAIGDLIIPEYKVRDNEFVRISQAEKKIQIIPENNILMFAVNNKDMTEFKEDITCKIETSVLTGDLYVEVRLLEALTLQVRGSKKSNLLGVRCYIPSIKTEAISINNAYTMISEVFEPDRKSHTGNVFDKCFYLDKDGKWHPLEDLRRKIESKYEEKLFLDYKVFALNLEKLKKENVDNSALLLIGYLHEYEWIDGRKIKELYNKQKRKYIQIVNDLLDKDIIYEIKEQVKK